jgi:hypothetical protein
MRHSLPFGILCVNRSRAMRSWRRSCRPRQPCPLLARSGHSRLSMSRPLLTQSRHCQRIQMLLAASDHGHAVAAARTSTPSPLISKRLVSWRLFHAAAPMPVVLPPPVLAGVLADAKQQHFAVGDIVTLARPPRPNLPTLQRRKSVPLDALLFRHSVTRVIPVTAWWSHVGAGMAEFDGAR